MSFHLLITVGAVQHNNLLLVLEKQKSFHPLIEVGAVQPITVMAISVQAGFHPLIKVGAVQPATEGYEESSALFSSPYQSRGSTTNQQVHILEWYPVFIPLSKSGQYNKTCSLIK